MLIQNIIAVANCSRIGEYLVKNLCYSTVEGAFNDACKDNKTLFSLKNTPDYDKLVGKGLFCK